MPGTNLGGGSGSQDCTIRELLAAGDVNGDGYEDVVAGAPRSWAHPGKSAEQVFLVRGGPDGLTGRGTHQLDPRDVHAVPDEDNNSGLPYASWT
ncbi:integrin alpha [Streptomyces sp. NPDC060035]|uniref:integrin alpha n=1 Tax=Streptomyces sp. NPDC060035 TaxID=3347044 RepID=UPI0036ABBCA2